MKKAIEKFSIEYLQILDEKGNIDSKLMPKLSKQELIKMYELMILSRKFDEKALKMQRQGRIGTYASILGQEAAQIGSALAMKKEDWVFPAFRENGVFIARGMPMEYLFLYWGGDERGSKFPEGMNDFPVSIPVGSQPVYASGFAIASKIKKEKVVSFVYFGDGATSEGDFHEGMNFAGAFQAPIVFMCQNNQWAISIPREKQTASKTIAQKAIGYGVKGIQIDGNDVLASYVATKEAVERARKGEGPTLIEFFTYRMENHTTADDWKRYRGKKEVDVWKKKDPIERFRLFLEKKKIWNKKLEKEIQEKAEKMVEEAVKKYEGIEKALFEDIFNYTFYELPPELKEQKEEFKKVLGEDLKNGGR